MATDNEREMGKAGARRVGTITRVAAATLVVGSLVAELSCGGGEPEPETPEALMPTATVTSTAPAPPPPPTTAPTATQPSPLAPIEPALAQAAQAVLEQVAKEEAPPGAKAVGMPKVSLLGTGQFSEMTLSMAPGKCYTVIAVGLPPVAELNVQLLPSTTVPGMQTVLAEDQMVGARAVVGKSPNCYKWPLPVAAAARVVTTVAAGTGLVATQIYEK